MNISRSIAAAAVAAALGGGAALATPAQAVPGAQGVPGAAAGAKHAAASARPHWHTIWQSKFKPRHSTWTSGNFGVHAYNLTVKYRCWNGGDGTRASASVVEADSPHRTMGRHAKAYCNGTWWSFTAHNVRPSTPYRVTVEQDRHGTHTEEVGAYEYY